MKSNITHFLVFFLLFCSITQLKAQERLQLANNPEVTPEIIERDPVISWDGQTLIFISNKDGQWKFYEASLGENKAWANIKPLEKLNAYSNSAGTIHSPSLNYNGTKLFFAANYENDGGGMNIYVAEKKEGNWGEPIQLDKPINTDEYEGSPSVTPDGRTLYFVRNNPLSENKDYVCRLIYVAYQNERGRWTAPELLPSPINLECEENPKIALDGKTLYFSSVRKYKDDFERESQDGYDLYYAKRYGSRIWYNPIILDSLNTDNDELSPSIGGLGHTLFYSSGDNNKKNPKKRFGSVYAKELPKAAKPLRVMRLQGTITDLISKKPVGAKLKITNAYTSELFALYENNSSTGKYDVFLPVGNHYQIDVYNEGYSHTIFHYDLRETSKSEFVSRNVEIYPTVRLTLNVFDEELFESLNAKVEIFDQESGEKVEGDLTAVKEVDKGRFELTLPIGRYYRFHVEAKHYKEGDYLFDMRAVVQFSEYEKDFTLSIKKEKLKLFITDKETEDGLAVDFSIKNLTRRENVVFNKLDVQGEYVLDLRAGDQYELSCDPKGYSYYNQVIDMEKEHQGELHVALQPIKKETKFVLNNITFEVNSADLKEESYLELNRVFDFIAENKKIIIELSAHTDDQGTDAYNLLLSDKRAESVRNYLIEKGIEAERLVSKGYGESTPLVENSSEENRAKNRRVEMKIINVKEGE